MARRTKLKGNTALLTAPLTGKGQVTIPKSIRMLLKLEGRHVIGFRVIRGRVEVVPVEVRASANPFTEEEWGKIERLSRQRGKSFNSPETAKQYARSL